MRAFRLVILASMCLFLVSVVKAQVKIGDNPLDIGTERLLEIERANELLIVTDSLEFGITSNKTSNLTTDALMIKLHGWVDPSVVHSLAPDFELAPFSGPLSTMGSGPKRQGCHS